MHDPDPWLGVEPRHLATFVAVADAGSFRGAAARLGYVQSAVSQQMVQLERALGTRLIDRGPHRTLTLTPAGRRLLEHARRIVDRMRAACADVELLTGARPLRLAVEPGAESLLPLVAPRLAPSLPPEGVFVTQRSASEQITEVLDGRLDVAVGCFPELPPNVRAETLRVDEWVVVARSQGELPPPGEAQTSLTDHCLIESTSHPLPSSADDLRASRVLRCDRAETALQLVRSGVGVAVLPALAVETLAPDLACAPVGDLLPPRAIALVWAEARRVRGLASASEVPLADSQWTEERRRAAA